LSSRGWKTREEAGTKLKLNSFGALLLPFHPTLRISSKLQIRPQSEQENRKGSGTHVSSFNPRTSASSFDPKFEVFSVLELISPLIFPSFPPPSLVEEAPEAEDDRW